MSTIKSVEPIIVEEDRGLLTPGLSVNVEFSDGEILDRYCGLCLAHLTNREFICFNVYTKIIYCKGTHTQCRNKFNELKTKMKE